MSWRADLSIAWAESPSRATWISGLLKPCSGNKCSMPLTTSKKRSNSKIKLYSLADSPSHWETFGATKLKPCFCPLHSAFIGKPCPSFLYLFLFHAVPPQQSYHSNSAIAKLISRSLVHVNHPLFLPFRFHQRQWIPSTTGSP